MSGRCPHAIAKPSSSERIIHTCSAHNPTSCRYGRLTAASDIPLMRDRYLCPLFRLEGVPCRSWFHFSAPRHVPYFDVLGVRFGRTTRRVLLESICGRFGFSDSPAFNSPSGAYLIMWNKAGRLLAFWLYNSLLRTPLVNYRVKKAPGWNARSCRGGDYDILLSGTRATARFFSISLVARLPTFSCSLPSSLPPCTLCLRSLTSFYTHPTVILSICTIPRVFNKCPPPTFTSNLQFCPFSVAKASQLLRDRVVAMKCLEQTDSVDRLY